MPGVWRLVAKLSGVGLAALAIAASGAPDPYRANPDDYPTEVTLLPASDAGARSTEIIPGSAPFEGQLRFESDEELRRWGGTLESSGAADAPIIESRPDGAVAIFRAHEASAASVRRYAIERLATGQNTPVSGVTNRTPSFRVRAALRIAAPIDGGSNPGDHIAVLGLVRANGGAFVDLSVAPDGALRLKLDGVVSTTAPASITFDAWHELEIAYQAATETESGDLRIAIDGVESAELHHPNHGVDIRVGAFEVGARNGTIPSGAAVECRWIRWTHRPESAAEYDADLFVAQVRDVSATDAKVLVVQHPAAFGWESIEALVEYADGRQTPAQTLLAEEGHAGAFHLTGLTPGAECVYRVVLREPGGGASVVSGEHAFRTLPVEPAVIRFGWLSCHEQNGMSHPYDIYSALEVHGVDFIAHLGDFHYNDSQHALPYPAERREIMNSVRAAFHDLPYAAAARRVPMFLMLDDHDVWSNNAGPDWATSDAVIPEHGGVTQSYLWHEGLAAWEFYFRRAMLNTGAAAASYRSWETARTLFVFLDTRSYARRTQSTMLGLEQRAWLLNLLAATDKENLVIFSPSVWGDVQDFRDNWEGGGQHTSFHAERAMIEDAIEASAALRAIILSGDRHCSLIHTRLAPEKLLFEACAGPASNNVFFQYTPEDAALPGVIFCSTDGADFPPVVTPPEYAHMGGRIVLDELAGTITVQIIDADDGRIMRSYTPGVTVILGPDLNGDGVVNFQDLNMILGAWGQQGPDHPADANGDGSVDFADLNLVLSVYNLEV